MSEVVHIPRVATRESFENPEFCPGDTCDVNRVEFGHYRIERDADSFPLSYVYMPDDEAVNAELPTVVNPAALPIPLYILREHEPELSTYEPHPEIEGCSRGDWRIDYKSSIPAWAQYVEHLAKVAFDENR